MSMQPSKIDFIKCVIALAVVCVVGCTPTNKNENTWSSYKADSHRQSRLT